MDSQPVGRERMVRWVDEFARGVGVPTMYLDTLLAGVQHALVHADSEGTPIDRVAVVRGVDAVEVQLHCGNSAPCETFLLQY